MCGRGFLNVGYTDYDYTNTTNNDSSDNESEIQIEDNESSTLLAQDNENRNILDEDMIYETEEEEPTSTIPWLLYTIKKYRTCQL